MSRFLLVFALLISFFSTASADWVTATLPIGTGPHIMAVNPATNKIYMTNFNDNSVTVINGVDNSTTNVTLGTTRTAPTAVGVNPVTDKIYVVNDSSNTVTVIDGITNLTTAVAVGDTPVAVG